MLRRFAILAAVFMVVNGVFAQGAPPAVSGKQVLTYGACGFKAMIPKPSDSERIEENGRTIDDVFLIDEFILEVAANIEGSVSALEKGVRADPDTILVEKLVVDKDGTKVHGITAVGDVAQASGLDTEKLAALGVATQARLVAFECGVGGNAVIVFGFGPTHLGGKLEDLVKQVVGSLKLINAEDAKPAGVPDKETLNKGELMLVGTVEDVDEDRRGFTLLATEVTSKGQESVELKPARKKPVVLGQANGHVVLGARLAVIGSDKGPGTPLIARVVQAVK